MIEKYGKVNTWGGKREGSGRIATGRKKKQYYVTEEEHKKIKEYINKLRDS